jgi:hypothetical protein
MTTLAILPPAGFGTISPTKAVSDPVAGRQVGDPPLRASPAPYSPATDRNMSSRGGGGATQRHSLSTCHPNGAPVAVKEDTVAVAKLLFVRLISKDLKVVVCLLVGEEEKQTQELAMDASRGRHVCRQESHLPIVLIWVTIVADLVSSGALEVLIWVVRVAELTPSVP